MSKKYYLCDVVQYAPDPTDPDYTEFGPAVLEYQNVQVLANQFLEGDSLVLSVVDTPNHNQFRNDSRIQPCPDMSIDADPNAIAKNIRDGFNAWATGKGLPPLQTNDNSYRLGLERIGKTANPDFNLDLKSWRL